MQQEVKIFSVKEAAQKLNLSKHQTYQLIKAGKLPHIRLGKKIGFTDEIIAEIIRSFKVESNTKN